MPYLGANWQGPRWPDHCPRIAIYGTFHLSFCFPLE